jgi:hypothetical protein
MKNENQSTTRPKVRWSMRILDAFIPAVLMWNAMTFIAGAYAHIGRELGHSIFQLAVAAFSTFAAFFYLVARLRGSRFRGEAGADGA